MFVLLVRGSAAQPAYIRTIDDFTAAAANTSVLTFSLGSSLQLNGSALLISRPGQDVVLLGDCASAAGCPLLDAQLRSRPLQVVANSLSVYNVSFANGLAGSAGGGCVLATVNSTAAFVGSSFTGCSATGSGGAVQVNGLLAASQGTFSGCTFNGGSTGNLASRFLHPFTLTLLQRFFA